MDSQQETLVRVRSLLVGVLALVICGVPLHAEERDPSDFVRVLEDGPREEWDTAARQLVGYNEKYDRYSIDARSLGSLLKRWQVFSWQTRELIAAGMRSLAGTNTPETVAVFTRLLADPKPRIRKKTFEILIRRGNSATTRALAEYVPENPQDKKKLTKYLERITAQEAAKSVAKTRTDRSAGKHPSEQSTGLRQYGLAAALIAAGSLGTFILLWGFRMLQLQRLLPHLAPASARTITLGLASLRGEVQPYEGRLLVHPLTEEVCVYYSGAEEQTRDTRFWLVDDTGRVLVDPRGVVLISEDQTLVPGERVHILGTAERMSRDGTAHIVVGRSTDERMLTERLLLLPVRVLFGILGASERIAATLFTRPEASFWIWDDLHHAPMTLQRDLALVFGSMLAAAGWITLFVAAAIAVLG